MTSGVGLPSEDAKLVVLARGARGRAAAAAGAAVRDSDGRTYAAGAVDLPSLKLTAIQAAVAAAVSSGAEALEMVVLVGPDPVDDNSRAVASDLGAPEIILAGTDGAVRSRQRLADR